MSDLPKGLTVRRDAGLYGYERALRRAGIEPDRRRRRGGPRCVRGPAGRGRGDPAPGKLGMIPGLADSKLLTETARERCYAQIVRRAVAWSVVAIEPEECDRLGMHVANVEALRRAVALLDLRPAYVLTDGFPVDGFDVPGLAMWKGDRVAACISAASVLAKVTRDRLMRDLHARAPGVRLRRAQGLHHRSALRAAARARPVSGAPDALRERPPGRRAGAVARGAQ